MTKLKSLFTAILFSLVPTLLLWLPFYFRLDTFWTIPLPKEGMATVVANYDGPLYIAVAKSFYNPEILGQFNFNLDVNYFAAHFPLYPILVKIFAALFGFTYATLVVTAISSVGAIYVFSKFITLYVDKKDILWMTFLFSIFPARWLIVRSVGSPEPLFMAFIISAVYFFKNKKYLLTGIFGALAALTKSPGILLFPALLAAYYYPIIKESINIKRKEDNTNPKAGILSLLPIILIPLATLLVFVIYKFQYNDFFAYFHSGDNIHLFFPPFQIFNFSGPWVGTFWLEEIILVYLLCAIGIIKLIKTDKESAWFAGIFFLTTLFIAHRDLIRYTLPVIPFLYAGFSPYLIKREFKLAFYLVIIPIYLFSIAFISKNVMPISDWTPLL